MLKLTKSLCLCNELFIQHIPIQDDALMQVHFAFRVDVLSILEVINSGIDRVCIALKSVFRTLVISFIGNSVRLSMKIQKDFIDEAMGRHSTSILWRLK